MKPKFLLIILICLALTAGNSAFKALDVLAEGQVSWPQIGTDLVVGGFKFPVHITNAGDGSGRLFVVEQQG